jgi:RND family efflux transporter MFP subunit
VKIGLCLCVIVWGCSLTAHVWAVDSSAALRCVIKPYSVVALGAPVEGMVEKITVDQGDTVKEGQIVALLESSRERAAVVAAQAKADIEAAIKSSEIRIEFTARKVARARDLRKSNAIGQHELDEAETEQRLAEAAYLEATENKRLAQLELERARADLAIRTVRSPIDGIVVERLLSPGEIARLTPIVMLMQIDPLRVDVFVPSAWLGQVQPGMIADIAPATGAWSRVYEARVGVVNKVVDSTTDTFTVRLELPNPDRSIPAGMACTVRFRSQ